MKSDNTLIASAVCREIIKHSAQEIRGVSCIGLALTLCGAPTCSADNAAGQSSMSTIYVNGLKPEENYDTAQPTLDKLTQPIVDTPQSMTVLSQAELQDRGSSNLNDALRTVPGISLGAGETSWQGNNIFLRGFTTRDDMFADGQRDFGYYYRDPFNTEQVEVLKGPSSILFGRGSTGGVINQVSKTPTMNEFLAVSGSLSTSESKRLTVARTAAVYGLDTIDVGEHLQVMGGVRWDRFAVRYNSVGYTPAGAIAALTGIDRVDTGFSYRGAVAYKPTEHSSIYATFGTSFDPSAEGIDSLISSGRAVAQANLHLDPEKSKSYEVGSKWDLASGRVLLTGAAFKLEQYNVRVPDPANTGFNVLGGDQQVKGLEIEIVGRLTDAWKIRAGYTYLNTETTRSEPGGPLLGTPLTITPRNMETLFTEYRLIAPLQVGFGVLGESCRLAQDTAARPSTRSRRPTSPSI